jgi:hypothetical protein
MLLRLWRIEPTRAAAVVSVLALVDIPNHWAAFGFERMVAAGAWENLLQASMQGVFAGPLAIYLFTRSVVLLGAARGRVSFAGTWFHAVDRLCDAVRGAERDSTVRA